MFRFRTWLRLGFLTGVLGVFYFLAGVATTWLLIAPTLPSVETLADADLQVPLRVYTADGVPIAVFGTKRRIPVNIEDVPDRLKHAFIAAEDDRFYEHPGVDYQGILRATWHLIRTGRKTQGGSTITMQLARNFFLTFDQTYIRKLREIFLAFKIERHFTKKRIFELYLNKIYMGHRAYGVGAAAQVYYGKDLHELTLAQTAAIASLPKAPSVVNPIDHPEESRERRNYVLRRMHEEGYITDAQYHRARSAPVTASLHGTVARLNAPYAAELARRFALDHFGQDAYTGGYSIYMTIKSRMQRAAREALRSGLLAYTYRHGYRGPEAHIDLGEPGGLDKARSVLANYFPVAGLLPGLVLEAGKTRALVLLADGRRIELPLAGVKWAQPYINANAVGEVPDAVTDVVEPGDIIRVTRSDEGHWRLGQIPDVQGAIVALDSFNGAIRALVGGFDFTLSKYNRAIQIERQPGSSFKPFIYSAALSRGLTAATLINDAPVVYDNPELTRSWRPQNYSQTFGGPTRLREGLVHSINLIAIRVLREVGVEYAIDWARRFGFDVSEFPHNLSLALGSAAVSPWDMAQAYAVFANGGFRVQPHYIARVVGQDGKVLYSADPAVACLECGLPVAEAVVQSDVPVMKMARDAGQPPGSAGYVVASHRASDHAEPVFSLAPRVIKAGNAFIMDSFMEDVVLRGTATRALKLGRSDLSGKTGTTNNQTNAWFCGYVHGLVATVWVGFDRPQPLGVAEVGGRAALPIWMDFMEVALENKPERDLPMPTGVVTVRIDPETGQRTRPGTPGAILEYFMAGTVPPLPPREERTREDKENPYGIF